jgi:glycosyltransferase involved in cell wall biosynthesis
VESLKACRFVVAPTRFGQRVIREAGIPNVMYVPCAFDPKVMFQSKEDRGALRERFGKLINRDLSGKYLVNVVAANSGKRKNFPAIFEAWKMFYAKHPDAILYLHTEITGKWADGENLAELMKLYEIDDNSVLFVSQYHYNTGQIGNDYLNLLYNTSDVHLNTCVGEGFGLPIMDAQACGCPTIVPDFAGAGEIGFGLKITRGMKHPLVPGGLQFLVDPAAVADALEEMYGHKEDELLRMAMAEQAREYSLETVMEKYMKPVLEKIEGEIKK